MTFVIMMGADGLAPNGRQAIRNHHADSNVIVVLHQLYHVTYIPTVISHQNAGSLYI